MHKNKDFFQIIGHINIFFATLDFFASILLTEISKETYVKRPKLDAPLGQKLRFFKNLKEEDVNDVSVLRQLKKYIDEAIDISDERNRYIHDQWVFNEQKIKKGYIDRFRIKEGSKGIDGVTLSFDDLQSFLKKIGDMQKNIAPLIKSRH